MDISIAIPSNTYSITLSKEELRHLNAGKTLILEPSKTPICFRDFEGNLKDTDCHALHCRESSGEYNIQFLTIKTSK